MIIPREAKARDDKAQWILRQCLESQQERRSLYDMRRRYALFGASDMQRVKYNRLQAHLDLVSSFLYSADRARYTVAAMRGADDMAIAQLAATEEHWNDCFRDSGIAYQFTDAVYWSLVFDSIFMKVGWNDARDELFAKIIEPHNIGVFNEAEQDLESQEAFVHSYALDWDNAVMRLHRAGLADHVKKLGVVYGEAAGILPPVLNTMMISANAGPAMSGRLIGAVNQAYFQRATYESRSTNPMVLFHELWIWDDIAEDYCTLTICEPDIVISDSRDTIEAMHKATKKVIKYGSPTNVYLPGEHPFVHVSPFKIYNYFWGEAHCDRLIYLQEWTTETLDNIAELLEQQVDPAKVFSGFQGLLDEKAAALGGPGTWVMDQIPGAKVDRLVPEMPPELFANFQQIGQIFLEASGLTETVSGKGEQGVRGKGHARQLATTGSGRIRKVAVGLEEPLVRIGDLGLKLLQRNDPHPLTMEVKKGPGKGPQSPFLMSQIEVPWKIRVAGHSHSPLFSDESREMAVLLLKAQAIDLEMFVKMLAPPNEASILHSLANLMEQKKQAAMMGAMTGGQPKPGGRRRQNGQPVQANA
jgi:hypothetical protein